MDLPIKLEGDRGVSKVAVKLTGCINQFSGRLKEQEVAAGTYWSWNVLLYTLLSVASIVAHPESERQLLTALYSN